MSKIKIAKRNNNTIKNFIIISTKKLLFSVVINKYTQVLDNILVIITMIYIAIDFFDCCCDCTQQRCNFL